MASGRSRWQWGVWVPFVVLAIGPFLALLLDTLFVDGQGWTLAAYRDSWGSRKQWELLINSAQVGGGVAVGCLLLGLPFGFLVSRTDLRGRSLYAAVSVIPLLIPSYVSGIAWTQIQPMGGYPAIVFILTLTFFPIVAFLAGRGLREVGHEVEDAARLQLGTLHGMCRVTLPLAVPSVLAASLLVFALSISDFGVPDFFSFAGNQEQSFQVLSANVYFRWFAEQDSEGAVAAAMPLLLLACAAMVGISWSEGRRGRGAITGSHRVPPPVRLGRWSWIAHAYLCSVMVLSAGFPMGVVLSWLAKGTPAEEAMIATPPSGADAIVEEVTLLGLLQGPAGGDVLRSMLYAGLAAAVIVVVAVGPALLLARRRRSSSGGLLLSFVPLAIPSVFLGMAQLQTFDRALVPDPFFTGGGLVVVTYVARYLPLGVLALRASALRIAPEIHEASQLSVRSPVARFCKCTFPLLVPGIVVAATLCFGLALRDLDSIVLLDGAQRTLPLRLYNKVHYARDAEVAGLCLLQMMSVFVPWIVVRLLAPAAFRQKQW